MVRAASATATVVYTYTVDGLRIAQDAGDTVTPFAWDWATGVPELLMDGNKLYLVGHDTLGWEDAGGWTYAVPDALGSVRQPVDGAGGLVDAREWSPYGVEVGDAQAGLGYTGEWWDAAVGLQYLRARWYAPQVGIFTSRDQLRWNHAYAYGDTNPILYRDPSGFTPVTGPAIFLGGYIEGVVAQLGVSLFGPTTHGQSAWLAAAVDNISELGQLHSELSGELLDGQFVASTVVDLYGTAKDKARVLLRDSYSCVHNPELEAAHAALIVLANIPANHSTHNYMELWNRYPLYLPDGRGREPGLDKTGHFFLNAFTAFECKYSGRYTFGRESNSVWRMSKTMSFIVGGESLASIENDYANNIDAPYIDAQGLSGMDARIFRMLVDVGNVYELLTSLNHLPEGLGLPNSPDEMIRLLAGDLVNGRANTRRLVEELLAHEKSRDRNEGLLDSGVYRDQVANRLGIKFGLQVYSNPGVTPAIPHDVGRAGFTCEGDVCAYTFP